MTTTDAATPTEADVLSLAGDLDIEAVPTMQASLVDATARATTVALDLSAVTFLDSSGLAVLLAARQRLADAGGPLVLHHPSPPVRRLLAVTGVDQLFTIET